LKIHFIFSESDFFLFFFSDSEKIKSESEKIEKNNFSGNLKRILSNKKKMSSEGGSESSGESNSHRNKQNYQFKDPFFDEIIEIERSLVKYILQNGICTALNCAEIYAKYYGKYFKGYQTIVYAWDPENKMYQSTDTDSLHMICVNFQKLFGFIASLKNIKSDTNKKKIIDSYIKKCECIETSKIFENKILRRDKTNIENLFLHYGSNPFMFPIANNKYIRVNFDAGFDEPNTIFILGDRTPDTLFSYENIQDIGSLDISSEEFTNNINSVCDNDNDTMVNIYITLYSFYYQYKNDTYENNMQYAINMLATLAAYDNNNLFIKYLLTVTQRKKFIPETETEPERYELDPIEQCIQIVRLLLFCGTAISFKPWRGLFYMYSEAKGSGKTTLSNMLCHTFGGRTSAGSDKLFDSSTKTNHDEAESCRVGKSYTFFDEPTKGSINTSTVQRLTAGDGVQMKYRPIRGKMQTYYNVNTICILANWITEQMKRECKDRILWVDNHTTSHEDWKKKPNLIAFTNDKSLLTNFKKDPKANASFMYFALTGLFLYTKNPNVLESGLYKIPDHIATNDLDPIDIFTEKFCETQKFRSHGTRCNGDTKNQLFNDFMLWTSANNIKYYENKRKEFFDAINIKYEGTKDVKMKDIKSGGYPYFKFKYWRDESETRGSNDKGEILLTFLQWKTNYDAKTNNTFFNT